MMNRQLFIGLLLCATMLMVGCKKDPDTFPAYLHLDKIEVEHNSDGTTAAYGDAWLTSEIDAVQIELWFEGEKNTTQLGTFELPCTVPVLTDKRKIDKIHVYPFVKQNGIAATHIYYPYYEYFIGRELPLAPDSVTNIGLLDEDSLWTITVPYRSSQYIGVKVHEFF